MRVGSIIIFDPFIPKVLHNYSSFTMGRIIKYLKPQQKILIVRGSQMVSLMTLITLVAKTPKLSRVKKRCSTFEELIMGSSISFNTL